MTTQPLTDYRTSASCSCACGENDYFVPLRQPVSDTLDHRTNWFAYYSQTHAGMVKRQGFIQIYSNCFTFHLIWWIGTEDYNSE